VNGTFNYTLTSPNSTTVTVIQPLATKVDFNSNLVYGSQVPFFFVVVSAWSHEIAKTVLISASSRQYMFVGQYVQLNVTATCGSGLYVNISKGIMDNLILFYEFILSLSAKTQLCARCNAGAFSTPDTLVFCPKCSAGTFSNSNSTACERCPIGTWSRSGTHETCISCKEGVTTVEQDRCVTLAFLHPPIHYMISDVPNRISPIVLRDVFETSIVERSGAVFAKLQCRRPGCETELNSDFDLLTISLEIINGSAASVNITFTELSPIKVGIGFTWRIFTPQNPGALVSSVLDSHQAEYPISFLGVPPLLRAVQPTQIASVGGTLLTVTSDWKLIPRILNAFPNGSAVCVFKFLGRNDTSSGYRDNLSSPSTNVREERTLAKETSEENIKVCLAPAVPEFSTANLSIILQDGRRSVESVSLLSVCHNNFYVNSSRCSPCPASSTGQSTNSIINAESVESCVCAAGNYGTFGQFCRFCPRPSSLTKPPFICNSTNLRWPVVSPGYWVDYSMLARCDAVSATCIAVTTCAFGPRACPGGSEKLCTQNDVECYEGKGCGACCALFYNENNACFKCPDSNETTALLAVVAVFCFILAVLMSSISSPSFTQSGTFCFFIFF
jgi:hypothetical protein